MLWACGIAGVVGMVLGLRYRVLVVIVLTWAILALGVAMVLWTGDTVGSGIALGLAAAVALHIGYFGSSVAGWAWTRKAGPVGRSAPRWRLRWRRRRSATS